MLTADNPRARFTCLAGNRMRLDGGAMFGNAPKALWQKWVAPDDRNMIDIATQALLVRTRDRVVLFETGPGAYLPPELKARFGFREDRHVLLDSLASQGLSHEDVTHVILSHLHFDHAGGLLRAWTPEAPALELLFPNAWFMVSEAQFERACHPHDRDRASYIPELPDLLKQSGRLRFVRDRETLELGGMGIGFALTHGHTPGMLVSWIRTGHRTLAFTGDLIPARPWVNRAITMGYDRFPEGLVDEKKAFLEQAMAEEALLVFPHDTGASRLSRDAVTGRIVVGQAIDLAGRSIALAGQAIDLDMAV